MPIGLEFKGCGRARKPDNIIILDAKFAETRDIACPAVTQVIRGSSPNRAENYRRPTLGIRLCLYLDIGFAMFRHLFGLPCVMKASMGRRLSL